VSPADATEDEDEEEDAEEHEDMQVDDDAEVPSLKKSMRPLRARCEEPELATLPSAEQLLRLCRVIMA